MSRPTPAPPTQARAPWHFRLGKWLGRRGVRGSGLLIRVPERLGLLHKVVRYPLVGPITVDVPLYRRANQWDLAQVREYEAVFLDRLADIVRSLPEPATLIDCGADIGLFSLGLLARAPLARVIAFEPDPSAFEILSRNLARLTIASEARREALGAEPGRGVLVRPADSEHAAYLAAQTGGVIEVVRLDDALRDRPELADATLVLKFDLEGGEFPAIQGAERLIRQAKRCVVAFEAHRQVALRTGVDPIRCAQLLASWRDWKFAWAEFPERTLRLERPIFEQFPEIEIGNVLAISEAEAEP